MSIWDEAFDEGYEAGLEAQVEDLRASIKEGNLQVLFDHLENLGAMDIRWSQRRDLVDYTHPQVDTRLAFTRGYHEVEVTLTLCLG